MAINLSPLVAGQNAALSLSGLILAIPAFIDGTPGTGYQPQNAPTQDGVTTQNPPVFVFDYEGEQTLTFESDITDNYVEDNTAKQDQISLRPEIITTRGFIGELNDVPPKALGYLKTAADKLTTVGAYVPVLTEAALIAYNEAILVYQTAITAANSAVAAWNSVNGQSAKNKNQTKQAIAFGQFYGYWKKRTLFTIQTPWGTFQDYAIQRVKATQDATTRMVSEFEVSFKQMRFATTAETSFNTLSFIGRSNAQSSPTVNLGTSTPSQSISLNQGLSNNFAGVF